MKIKIDNICESAKVAVALILAELTINTIKENSEKYNFCRKSIDICWEWLGQRNINVDQLCLLIENDDLCLANITLETEDETLANKYGTIMIAVSYLIWQEFNIIKDYYPEYLECVDDDYLEDLINDVIEKDKIIEFNDMNYIIEYLEKRYPSNSKEQYCLINKIEMLKVLKDILKLIRSSSY